METNKEELDHDKQTDNIQNSTTKSYKTTLRSNEEFFKFYRQQGIIPDEEFEEFSSLLATDLPSSFRIQLCLPERDRLITLMEEEYFTGIKTLIQNGEELRLPEKISFLPYTYQMEMPRQFIRRQPLLKHFHDFLVDEVELGNISRQEIVSMIPPLLLDIRSDSLILDACASPGSKTMQMLELMSQCNSNPEGLIVANDVDNKRCYMLVHQTLKRMPTANIVVVNHDASRFPAIVGPENKPLLFDRVLCDVICSGDGTLRKNLDLWERWSPLRGADLHRLQIQISKRCFELLAPGGLMCYSTCSLNPIEDEAVVAHLLRTFQGQLELVDVNDQLPGLKRSSGMSKWKVFGGGMREFNSITDVDLDNRRRITTTMFPPTTDESEWMNLDRSFRILPHKHNTGGFFVALLRKTNKSPELGPSNFCDTVSSDPCLPTIPKPKKPRRNDRGFRENPFIFFEDQELTKISADLNQHYGVDPLKFPIQNLLSRNESSNTREVYFVNSRLRDFLRYNIDRFKIINAGVALLRNDKKVSICPFRLKQDGLKILFPYLTKRIVDVQLSDFISILNVDKEKHYKNFEDLSNSEPFAGLTAGSVVVRVSGDDSSTTQICAWIGARTINPFVTREERVHLLRMLGASISTLQRREGGKKNTQNG